ncbi:actin 1 [Mycena albidolilacea]|uniref:Centractin n=1 Tax=Mycena albidolilacea TaxID=1033008 RepID=A0AAD6ZV84_9AGAR|nr:actin 1 [Mycena albidolilacea]
MYMDDDAVALVFDNGSATSRAGCEWLIVTIRNYGDDMPSSIFPSVTGRPRHQGFLPPGYPRKDCYIGDEALAKRGILGLKHPIQNGWVHNWRDMEAVWRHTLLTELRVAPEEHPVLLADAPDNPKTNREKAAEVLFEAFGVPAFYVQTGAVLALYAAGRSAGVVLDSGEGVSTCVPVYEGAALRWGVRSVDVAGWDMTDGVMRALMERGYPMTTAAEREIVRDIKETLCYVTLDFEREVEAQAPGAEPRYELPDGQVITIADERFNVPETLFKPPPIDGESLRPGIHELIFKTITSCDAELQPELYKNIVLSGGNTLFPGLPERLTKELRKLAPPDVTVEIHAPRERKYSAWMGGSIMASLSTFRNLWCSRQDYDEFGPAVVHRKCL